MTIQSRPLLGAVRSNMAVYPDAREAARLRFPSAVARR